MIVFKPAKIEKSAMIGEGTKIGEFSYIGKNVRIGKNCSIMQHVTIAKKTWIGDSVFIGPNVSILNDKYPPTHNPKDYVTIADDVIIGGGATILPGVVIDAKAVIGAGSVVTKHVEYNMVVIGNPAKPVMNRLAYDIKKRSHQ